MTYEGKVKDGVVVFAPGTKLPEGTRVTIIPVNSGADTNAKRSRHRFEDHFGAIDLGHPTDADNPSIDADLTRAYTDGHENG